MDFASRLLKWYQLHKRDLPWRGESDPYKIWLSEIILQQTRIVQGMDYYHRFVDAFPDVHALARASEDQVLSLWQGLGYYSRARSLHFTARHVAEKYQGVFPDSYQELLKLKGVGPYTAAAIASMAFGEPVAAIDGNVIRLIARYFYIRQPVDLPATLKEIRQIAQELMDPSQPGAFNQAMMDFGSLVCKPASPDCGNCPFGQDCTARKYQKQNTVPFKARKTKTRKRFFHFFFIYAKKDSELYFLVHKRKAQDIWKNLYQLPLLESNNERPEKHLADANPFFPRMGITHPKLAETPPVRAYSHQLTHQRIEAFFYNIELKPDFYFNFENEYMFVTFDEFEDFGKPVLIQKFLEKNRQILQQALA